MPLFHPAALSILQKIQLQAGTAVALKLSTAPLLDGPVVIHSREICLPEKALNELNESQLEGMIAHELAHVVRGDYFWILLLQVVRTLFFFQPLHRQVT